MALIKCSECGKDVSDKAVSCPNCGNPINSHNVNSSVNQNGSTKAKNGSGTSNVLIVGIVLIVLRIVFAFFTQDVELAGFAHKAVGRMDEYVLKMYFVQGIGSLMSFIGIILIIIGIVLTIKNSKK